MKKHFNFYNLAEREQKEVKAGDIPPLCLCGCAWANCGGSSSAVNYEANRLTGKISKDFEPQDAG